MSVISVVFFGEFSSNFFTNEILKSLNFEDAESSLSLKVPNST